MAFAAAAVRQLQIEIHARPPARSNGRRRCRSAKLAPWRERGGGGARAGRRDKSLARDQHQHQGRKRQAATMITMMTVMMTVMASSFLHLVLRLVVPGRLTVTAAAATGRRGVTAALIRRRAAPPPVNIRQVRVVVRARAVLVPPRARPRPGVDSHLGGGGLALVVLLLAAGAGDGESGRDAAACVRGRGRGRQLVVSGLERLTRGEEGGRGSTNEIEGDGA